MRWRTILPFVAFTFATPLAFAAAPHAVQQAQLGTLQTRLQIDAATAERMQSVVDKYKTKMAPVQRADVALLGQLRDQLALGAPDAKRMKYLSAELVKNRARLQTLRDDRLHELQKALTPAQFARLLVTWPRLTRELRKDARKAARG